MPHVYEGEAGAQPSPAARGQAAFELRHLTLDDAISIYADGTVDGGPKGYELVVNRIPQIVTAALGQYRHSHPELNAFVVAQICHEANRAFCLLNGDPALPNWGKLPEELQRSCLSGVLFTIANPEAGDSASHESWAAERMGQGWVYGPTLDRDAKIHPNLVPFDQLPREQQFKDRLFRTIVLAALAAGQGQF